MKKIYDKLMIENYLEKTYLSEQFDTKNLDFLVIKYQQGEFLTRPQQRVEYFQFIIRGSVALYYIDEDGIKRMVGFMENTGLLGGMEFALNNMPIFYTEAVVPVTVLALPMDANRSKLERDCLFLMYLLRQSSETVSFSSRKAIVLPRLRERLLYYLKYDCPHRTIIGMENTAAKLQCSRRQLQRTVKILEEEGMLLKVGRGCYRLQ